MLLDIVRFNVRAKDYLHSDMSLGQCLADMGMSAWFQRYYLLAVGASIWSTPVMDMLHFPAQAFIRFFMNHGLLTINHQPQWYTIQGGSKVYVERVLDYCKGYRTELRLRCGVVKAERQIKEGRPHIMLTDTRGQKAAYDQVVFACHSDQVLSILQQPTPTEQEIIGAIRYQSNHMILHSDLAFMPHRRNAWSSWVYLSEAAPEHTEDGQNLVSLSYWMNNLQPLATKKPVLVTLNPGREPDAACIYDRYSFRHPVFDQQAIAAQKQLSQIQGKQGIWYAGAWQRYGFHEDGLLSAIHIAEAMHITAPWIKK